MRSEERRELYGAWAERWPSDAADLLDGYSGAWWIGGSWVWVYCKRCLFRSAWRLCER